MAIAKTGRPRKWESQYTGILLPVEDRAHYEAEAKRHGLSTSSYLIWQLALQHGRPIPAALEAEIRAGQQAKAQAQLDMPAAS